jgi:hypothetical protein
VSAPADPEEREADRAADAFVARAPLPAGFDTRSSPAADVHRKCSGCEEERVFLRKAGGNGAASGAAAIPALGASRGEALAPQVRQPYERFFGTDLSAMRVHTGESADTAAQSLSAHAFSYGNDVYFRRNRFDPSSVEGQRLLAHETAHVVRQTRSGDSTIHRAPAHEEGGVLDTLTSFGEGVMSTGRRVVSAAEERVVSAGRSIASTGENLVSAGAGLALDVVERVAPGALAFFRGIHTSVVERVRSGFEGMFGGLARRVRTEGFTAVLGSVIAELAGGAARGVGEFLAGRCAALGAGAEILLQLGLRFGRAQLESLRQTAAGIGAFFGELWDAYGAPAADALGSFASGIWEGITAQVAEWWQALAPVREIVGDLWDSVVRAVTQGFADLQELQNALFRAAVEEWEKVRKQILPFMDYVKVVGVVLVLLSPLGPFAVVGAVAYGLYELVSYVWQTWGRQLTDDVRTYLATEVLPAIMRQLATLQAGIDAAKAWFGDLADQLAAQAAALLQASGALPYLQLLREAIGQLAAELQSAAKSLGALVDEFATAAAELVRAAVEFFRPIAEFLRQSLLVLVLGPLAILDDGVWETVKTFARLALGVPCVREIAEFARLPAILEQGEQLRAVFKAAWELMKNPEPIWDALRETLAPMAARVPGLAAATVASLLYPTERVHREGVELHLQRAIESFRDNWWEELKNLAWTLIWPFDELGTQLPLLLEHGTNSIRALFNLEIGLAIDEFLGMMQSANAILGALWGWFAIAAVLVGGALGALGVEFTAGASIGAGAAAGWALAAQVGIGLLVAMVATEGAIIAHSMFDLRYTNRIIEDEDAQAEADESDYEAIARSVFSIAVVTALVLLGAAAQKLASAVWRLAGRVPRLRLVRMKAGRPIREFLNRPRGRAARAIEEPAPVAEEPARPVEEPARPAEEPARPIEEPARPVTEEPARPVEEPARPTEEPTPVAEEPARPVEEPARPAEEPVRPAEEPARPVEEPAAVPEEPARPVEEPARPAEEPARPVEEPAPVAEEPARPAEEPPTAEEAPAVEPRPAEEVPGEEAAPAEEVASTEGPQYGPKQLVEVTTELRERAARLREGLAERRAAARRGRERIERRLESDFESARTTEARTAARRRAAEARERVAAEEHRIQRQEFEARRLEAEAEAFEEAAARAAQAHQGRNPYDIAAEDYYKNNPIPDASSLEPRVGLSAAQNADVARLVRFLEDVLGAEDVRVNQRQVTADRRGVGINRPDVQYTLNGERYYIEWDTSSSSRGAGHASRIQLNDPTASSVRSVTLEPGYPPTEVTNNPARITLITMD